MKIGKGGVEARHGIERKIAGAILVISISIFWSIFFSPIICSILFVSTIRRNVDKMVIEKLVFGEKGIELGFKFADLVCPFNIQCTNLEVGFAASRNEMPFAYLTAAKILSTQRDGFHVEGEFLYRLPSESVVVPPEFWMKVENHVLLTIKGNLCFRLWSRFPGLAIPIVLLNTPGVYLGNQPPHPEKLIETLGNAGQMVKKVRKRELPVQILDYVMEDTDTQLSMHGHFLYRKKMNYLTLNMPRVEGQMYIGEVGCVSWVMEAHQIEKGSIQGAVGFAMAVDRAGVDVIRSGMQQYLRKELVTVRVGDLVVLGAHSLAEQFVARCLVEIAATIKVFFLSSGRHSSRRSNEPLVEVQFLSVDTAGMIGRVLFNDAIFPIAGLTKAMNAGRAPSLSFGFLLNGKRLGHFRSVHNFGHKEGNKLVLDGVLTFHTGLSAIESLLVARGPPEFKGPIWSASLQIVETPSVLSRLFRGFGTHWRNRKGLCVGYEWQPKKKERRREKLPKFRGHYKVQMNLRPEALETREVRPATAANYFQMYASDSRALGQVTVDFGKKMEVNENYVRFKWEPTTFGLSISRLPLFVTLNRASIDILVGPRNSEWGMRSNIPPKCVVGIGYKEISAPSVGLTFFAVFTDVERPYRLAQPIDLQVSMQKVTRAIQLAEQNQSPGEVLLENESLVSKPSSTIPSESTSQSSSSMPGVVDRSINALIRNSVFKMKSTNTENIIHGLFHLDASYQLPSLEHVSTFTIAINVPAIYMAVLEEGKPAPGAVVAKLCIEPCTIEYSASTTRHRGFSISPAKVEGSDRTRPKTQDIDINFMAKETLFTSKGYIFEGQTGRFFPYNRAMLSVLKVAKESILSSSSPAKPKVEKAKIDHAFDKSINITTAVETHQDSIFIDSTLAYGTAPTSTSTSAGCTDGILTLPAAAFTIRRIQDRFPLLVLQCAGVKIDIVHNPFSVWASLSCEITNALLTHLAKKETGLLLIHEVTIAGIVTSPNEIIFHHKTLELLDYFGSKTSSSSSSSEGGSFLNNLSCTLLSVDARALNKSTRPRSGWQETVIEDIHIYNQIHKPSSGHKTPKKSTTHHEFSSAVIRNVFAAPHLSPTAVREGELAVKGFTLQDAVETRINLELCGGVISSLQNVIFTLQKRLLGSKKREISLSLNIKSIPILKVLQRPRGPDSEAVDLAPPGFLFLSLPQASYTIEGVFPATLKTPAPALKLTLALISPHELKITKQTLYSPVELSPLFQLLAFLRSSSKKNASDKPRELRTNLQRLFQDKLMLSLENQGPLVTNASGIETFGSRTVSGYVAQKCARFCRILAPDMLVPKKVFQLQRALNRICCFGIRRALPGAQYFEHPKDLRVIYLEAPPTFTFTNHAQLMLTAELSGIPVLVLPFPMAKLPGDPWVLIGIYINGQAMRKYLDKHSQTPLSLCLTIDNVKTVVLELTDTFMTDSIVSGTHLSWIASFSLSRIAPTWKGALSWISQYICAVLLPIQDPRVPEDLRLYNDSLAAINRVHHIYRALSQ
ncbi:hypothetical protein NEHOM01_0287 [Nematocida homosporus]|uniref:uncharacterized protein n=1 Tax=Nematocida homosporus TaxID=1912981 RepID=UPI00221FF77B|nr:uncharacterized protein NEHOM01_0287 [Nematocida homosporus]KAI5184612.1 hypothetical protein NEHOM01_0287 [Nematocida homosporus]